jgi:SPP1 family phage portal protein
MSAINFFTAGTLNTFQKYAERMAIEGIHWDLVNAIITDHGSLQARTLNRYGRYQQYAGQQTTPILVREFEGEAAKKINNKLANDFFGEIIDTKVGYLFGQPVTVNYDKGVAGYETAVKTIEDFKKINSFDDFNAEVGKFAAMCGYDAGLCYIDAEGQERVMRVDPWEAIILSTTEITEPQFGIRYYTTWDDKQRVDVYDSTKVYTFIQGQLVEEKDHMFSYCPLFGVPNNAELQGDGDKVLSLIDGYDRSLSDMNSEIEQFRNAYLKFIGYEPDEDVIAAMLKTGALFIPSSSDGESIEWMVKELNPAYVDSHLDRVEANITRFAKHVNFTDAFGGGQVTGPAMKYKLFALETKAKYFERKHEAAMLYMFKVLGSAWNVKSIPFDYKALDLVYTRNIPVNIVDEANAATTLAGITSKRTALSTLSVVKDVDEEMDLISKEHEEMKAQLDLDNPDLIDNNGGNNPGNKDNNPDA